MEHVVRSLPQAYRIIKEMNLFGASVQSLPPGADPKRHGRFMSSTDEDLGHSNVKAPLPQTVKVTPLQCQQGHFS